MNTRRRPLWIGLALALGTTVAFTSNAFAGHSVRDAVYPNGADVAVTVGSENATVGHDVVFYVTVSDRGSKAAQGVTMTDTIPAGTSLVAAVPQQGACAEVLNTVSCALGDLPSGGRTLVRVITTTPSTPQILGDSASAKAASPRDPNRSNNHTTGYTQTQPKFPEGVAGYIPPAGGTIGLAQRTSKVHPTSATVRGPRTTTGFQVYLDVYDPEYSDGCPDGATCFGQVVELNGLSGLTTAHPATITLRYDPSEIPGHKSITHTRVYDNYAIVPGCFPTAGKTASPDPCVVSRTVLASGDWQIVVRITQDYGEFRL
jgi:uncharacterized repeat protein (TIGR01451 family)